MAERLQKIIAESGLMSRRAAELVISEGRVLVNGRPAKLEIGRRAGTGLHSTEKNCRRKRKNATICSISHVDMSARCMMNRDENPFGSCCRLLPEESIPWGAWI